MKLVTKIQNYRFIFFLSVNQKNEYHIKISKKGPLLFCDPYMLVVCVVGTFLSKNGSFINFFTFFHRRGREKKTYINLLFLCFRIKENTMVTKNVSINI